MFNYIKSELYRVLHSKGIYILTGICTGLLLTMNVLLFICSLEGPDFPYNTTKFAFSMMTGAFQPILILTLCLGTIIFADEYKNRTLMNSISYGYSRIGLFLGKVAVGMIVSVLVLIFALAVFIGSAYLFLENSGTEYLYVLLKGFVMNIPILIAGEIGAYMFLFLFDKTAAVTWSWLGLIAFLPTVFGLLGLKFPLFAEMNSWLLYTVIGSYSMDGEGNIIMGYMTGEGAVRCLVSGCIGIVIFLVIGMVGMAKKEFK